MASIHCSWKACKDKLMPGPEKRPPLSKTKKMTTFLQEAANH